MDRQKGYKKESDEREGRGEGGRGVTVKPTPWKYCNTVE
jgi:hypothetical protein